MRLYVKNLELGGDFSVAKSLNPASCELKGDYRKTGPRLAGAKSFP